ncbi:MAG: hypothetical protein ACK4XK_12110, partial [Casimicrobiaceae bacterium]
MTKDRSFIDQVAANAAQEPAVVSRVIEEFCLALRRELDEYKGVNGSRLAGLVLARPEHQIER